MNTILPAALLSIALAAPAPAETWSSSPAGTLLCIELSRAEARAAFFLNRGLTGATFCASFPSGDAVLILRRRRQVPCIDNGQRTADGSYELTGRCGPRAVVTD